MLKKRWTGYIKLQGWWVRRYKSRNLALERTSETGSKNKKSSWPSKVEWNQPRIDDALTNAVSKCTQENQMDEAAPDSISSK